MPKGNSILADRWIGRRFGRLVVVDVLPERKALTKCDCGNVKEISRTTLCASSSLSCGCLRSEIHTDRWVGNRFGSWVILGYSKNRKVLARCDCGKVKEVYKTNLACGDSKSCGCMPSETKERHGYALSGGKRKTEYTIWAKMLARCYNEKDESYCNYGGRGIIVCERWHKFTNFLHDMGHRPKGLSIDRIDNNKGYSPENCRWATNYQQAANRRLRKDSVLLGYGGISRPAYEWAKIIGMSLPTLYKRLKKGWTVEEVITTPVRPKKPNCK